ncbi:MAG: translation initiation factor IF-2 [Candidatus Methanomethyliaceae archaeon]|nr:translation initiation factor IF-2 [Candidatus Methanomethyliaceae archaeon]
MPVRQPIVTVLGHVDVGKTLLLDRIRGTAVMAREVGAMTQHIGASFLPIATIESYCSSIIKGFQSKTSLPGILVVDTPGHEVFSNLRVRGGSVSDISILVIDIMEGVEKQTEECIDILKVRKTPFVVAANKVDKVSGWKSYPNKSFLELYKLQPLAVQSRVDDRIYRIVGELSRFGFSSDRFDRIHDFTKSVAIVPTSATTGDGIPELLALICGLVQQYLLNRLLMTEGPGRGVILETKEEPGLGTTIDVILFDGILNKGDRIVIGGFEGPITTKIRALLLPKPLNEMRDPEDKFQSKDNVVAAAGVKIVASGLEGAVSGAPVLVANDDTDLDTASKKIKEEMSELRFSTETDGVVVKADTLGSLEALVKFLKDSGIPVRVSDIGPIGKREIIEAGIVKRSKLELAAIVGFNVKVTPEAEVEAKDRGIPIFTSNVIYHIVDDLKAWSEKTVADMRAKEFSQIILPGEIRIIPGCVFRKNDPPIFGVEILTGTIKPDSKLMKQDGEILGGIMQIQDGGKTISQAKKGDKIAISVKGNFTVGRQVQEGETLLVSIPDDDILLLKEKYKSELSEEELAVIEKVLRIRWKDSPLI